MLKSRKRLNVGGCLKRTPQRRRLVDFVSDGVRRLSPVKQLPRSYWQCGMCGGGQECTVDGPLCVFVGRRTPASWTRSLGG